MVDKKYVLMKWKDGWQEVIGVEPDATDFNRYYVIERIEHFGRLVLNRPEGEYPGLIIIDRAPMEMEKMVMIEGGDERNFIQSSTYREGSRLEYNYDLQKGRGNFIEEIKNSIRDVLSKKGISSREILSKPDLEKIKEIENIGKALHIVGGKNQEDLIGFIQLLLEMVSAENIDSPHL
jgi:hypothetical protein